MKTNDLSILITAAVTSATLTVASFWATTLEAEGEPEILAAQIAKPKLVVQGVDLTLSHEQQAPQTGDEPVFDLVAVNHSGKPADLKVHLAMTAMSAADAMSRVVRMPAKLWECDQSITLNAGEQKTVTIATRTRLPDKKLISVTMAGANSGTNPGLAISSVAQVQQQIAVLNFATGSESPILVQMSQPGTRSE